MELVPTHSDFLYRYLCECPAPLALERSFECELLSRQQFRRPVLDVGCGEGLFASMLFREPVDVGLDPNRRELDQAARYEVYQKLLCCWGHEMPVESASFNTAFSNSVLEHIPDLPPVLREVYRVLRPGGRFFATVPSHHFDRHSVGFRTLSGLRLNGAAGRYQRFFNRFWQHHHYYSREGWSRKFEEAGFVVEQSRSYCPPRICLLNDLMAPLCAPSFVCKKVTNRWFLLPAVRRQVARGAALFCSRLLDVDEAREDSGLLFFALKKPE
jgi:SAM-dependent methyltransferase